MRGTRSQSLVAGQRDSSLAGRELGDCVECSAIVEKHVGQVSQIAKSPVSPRSLVGVRVNALIRFCPKHRARPARHVVGNSYFTSVSMNFRHKASKLTWIA